MQEQEKRELIKLINEARTDLGLEPFSLEELEAKDVEELRKIFQRYFELREEYKKKLRKPKLKLSLKTGLLMGIPVTAIIFLFVIFTFFPFEERVPISPALNQFPIGEWHFDEGSGDVVYDSSKNNHGTIYGATWVGGKLGKALSFDGVNDFIQLPHITVFNQHSFSISLWARFNDENVENEGLVESGDESSDDKWLHIVRRNGKPYFGFFNDDLVGNTYLSANKWWYLTFTWNATKKERKIYVNGILDASDISSGLLTVTSGLATGNGVRIARFFNSFLNGTIDEVVIYDRVLSEREINTFYQKDVR